MRSSVSETCADSVAALFKNLHVEEKVIDTNARTRRAACDLHARCATALKAHLHTLDRIVRTRAQCEARDRCDGRKCLAAKAHRVQRGEIIDRANLARRMPRDGEQRVLCVHPVAIIGHDNAREACGFRLHLNACRACIDRILDELFDDARGPLHDLAGCDLIDEITCEKEHARTGGGGGVRHGAKARTARVSSPQ